MLVQLDFVAVDGELRQAEDEACSTSSTSNNNSSCTAVSSIRRIPYRIMLHAGESAEFIM